MPLADYEDPEVRETALFSIKTSGATQWSKPFKLEELIKQKMCPDTNYVFD
jgi:hypothetical protein